MADYQDIRGLRVKYLSADPSVTVAGEVWYNSTTGTLRSRLVTEAWSSSASMSLAKDSIIQAGVGTQASALVIGGGTPGGDTATTEEYNGTGWSAGGVLASARRDVGGAGTQTSALAFGGFSPPVILNLTEEYDGTTWTVQNVMGTATRGAAGAGTQTAALAIGGAAPGASTKTEEYDGTNWTAGGVLGTAQSYMAAGGTQTAAISFGGYPATTNAQTYNGTGWTSVNVMNTARTNMAGNGPQTAALGAGGVPVSTATETFDGTDWTTSPATLATGRSGCGGAGSSPAFVLFGGSIPATTAITEEFNISTNVITAGTWAAGTVFPTSSSQVYGAGPQTAALGIGGYPAGSPPTGKSFEYDGTAWSNEATLNPSTGTKGTSAAAGTQTACINAQNTSPAPPFIYTAAGEYDGTSWTNATARPTDNYSNAACGTQTAGLFFGGASSGTAHSNATLEYNGASWTIQNVMATGRSELGGSGTQTAALGAGGYSNPPPTRYAITEEYNGASWTAVGANLVETRGWQLSGTTSDSLAMAGGTATLPMGTTACSRYDGTSWATSPSMATGRLLAGAGSSAAAGDAWGSAGYYPGTSPNRTNTTEYFSVETSAANIETLTTS